MIDASDAGTFSNTRKVLHELCAHQVRSNGISSIFVSDRNQALSRCPVLVFANKSDIPNCMTVEKIYEGLNLAPLGQLGRKSAVVRSYFTFITAGPGFISTPLCSSDVLRRRSLGE